MFVLVVTADGVVAIVTPVVQGDTLVAVGVT